MAKRLVRLNALLLPILCASAATAAGQGIGKDSPLIVSWAGKCHIERGYIDIADTTRRDNNSNKPTIGVEEDATGVADGQVVSLGDGGVATYILDVAISNGPGPDFAVFENGFRELTPPNLWFLELAVVEVSSDGHTFHRFPAVSETQTDTPVGTFGQLDPDLLHNLAGKYPLHYGTPFDLEELSGTQGLDLNNITHIRVIDVVGSLNPAFGTADSKGNMINDPYPTPFWSGGFDLDALAILSSSTSNHLTPDTGCPLEVYPNPAQSGQEFFILTDYPEQELIDLSIIHLNGRKVFTTISQYNNRYTATIETPGYYFVHVVTASGSFTRPLIVK